MANLGGRPALRERALANAVRDVLINAAGPLSAAALQKRSRVVIGQQRFTYRSSYLSLERAGLVVSTRAAAAQELKKARQEVSGKSGVAGVQGTSGRAINALLGMLTAAALEHGATDMHSAGRLGPQRRGGGCVCACVS